MSLFKSAMFYRINDQNHINLLNNAAELEDALSGIPEGMPTGSQWRKLGFTSPFPGHSENLVWTMPSGSSVIMLATHERDLKGVTIKEHIAAKVRKIEEREQRKCYRKEIAQIRDDVEAALLPKAFIKHSYTMAMIVGDMLIIDSSSAKKSEDLLDYLRDAMGSLSVRPLTFKVSPDIAMTEHVQGRNSLGKQLGFLSQAKLVNSLKASVAFKDCDLNEAEPQEYLDQGFRVTELAMALYDDTATEQLRFRLNDQVIVKGIKFSDFVLDPIKSDADGDAAALVDGSLLLIRRALMQLAEQLIEHLGEDRIEVAEATAELDSDVLRKMVVEYLIAHGDATVHGIQRVARIGYNRAARLLDELEGDVVTGPDSHGKRQVIGFKYDSGASKEDLQSIAEQAADLVDGKGSGLKIGNLTVESINGIPVDASAEEDDEDDWALSPATATADEDDDL